MNNEEKLYDVLVEEDTENDEETVIEPSEEYLNDVKEVMKLIRRDFHYITELLEAYADIPEYSEYDFIQDTMYKSYEGSSLLKLYTNIGFNTEELLDTVEKQMIELYKKPKAEYIKEAINYYNTFEPRSAIVFALSGAFKAFGIICLTFYETIRLFSKDALKESQFTTHISIRINRGNYRYYNKESCTKLEDDLTHQVSDVILKDIESFGEIEHSHIYTTNDYFKEAMVNVKEESTHENR